MVGLSTNLRIYLVILATSMRFQFGTCRNVDPIDDPCLPDEDTTIEMLTNCTEIEAYEIEYRIIVNGNVSEEVWEEFAATPKTIKLPLLIEGSTLKTLNFTHLKFEPPASWTRTPFLIIMKNKYLTNIYGLDVRKQPTRIRGNQKLKMNFKKYKDASLDLQEEGECSFDSPISNLSELNECKSIYGNIEFAPDVNGSTNAKIMEVSGCIHMNGTALESLDFFDFKPPTAASREVSPNCRSVISYNERLCAGIISKNKSLVESGPMKRLSPTKKYRYLMRVLVYFDVDLQCQLSESTAFLSKEKLHEYARGFPPHLSKRRRSGYVPPKGERVRYTSVNATHNPIGSNGGQFIMLGIGCLFIIIICSAMVVWYFRWSRSSAQVNKELELSRLKDMEVSAREATMLSIVNKKH